MEAHIHEISKILHTIGERVEGNLICDINPNISVEEQNRDKIQNLQYLVRGKRRVCEIGVNAGHSLLLMLSVNPTAEYVLFDIGTHAYTRPCMEYICRAYPNTSIRIIYGDSKDTLPTYSGTFDFIHVDGGHNLPEVSSDYKEATRLIEPHCPIVFDDYDYPVIYTFLDERIARGEISTFNDTGIVDTHRHIVITTNPVPH